MTMNGNEKPDFIRAFDVEEGEDDDKEKDEEEDSDEEDKFIASSSDENSEWNVDDEDEADVESFNDQDSDSPCNTSSFDDQTGYDRVLDLLKGGCDLQALKVDECRTYLRKHGLRLTGTKAICIQRIQEHWRVKDGNGEKLYPRSSFTINCTGDVCKGDIVLFKQRIYEKFNKVTRNGKFLGRRTVAGRIVNESYGAAKHQHTFTVEVLWCEGTKKLPPMFPLLVKGRNLYRLRTFRQPWHNEAERSKVLSEKHKRGAKARHFKAMKKAYSSNRGAKRQKCTQQTISSQKSYRIQESGAAGMMKRKYDGGYAEAQNPMHPRMKKVARPREPSSSSGHFQPNHPAHHPNPYTSSNGLLSNLCYASNVPAPRDVMPVHSYRGPQNFANYKTRTTAMTPPLWLGTDIRELHHQGYKYSSNYPPAGGSTTRQIEPRGLNCWLDHSFTNNRPLPTASTSGVHKYRSQFKGPMHCQSPGCRDLRAENCVILSCRRCCRRTGRRCPRHST